MDTEKLSKLELLPMVVFAATSCIDRTGSEGPVDGLAGPIKTASVGLLSFAMRTPKSMAHGESSYGLDIWQEGKKVFSVCWNSPQIKDYEVVTFKRGPWVPQLLGMATSAAITAEG